MTKSILRLIFLVTLLFFPKSVLAFSGSGTGTALDPYQITSCSQLQEMNADKAANYVQQNDISCTETSGWNAGAGFIPIGQSASKFTGSFNVSAACQVSHCTISDLYINKASALNGIGLFGYTSGASIFNVRLTNYQYIDTFGNLYVGSVVGNALNGTISNCDASGSITASFNGYYTGGLIGYANGTVITNSSTSVSITKTGSLPMIIGGFIGALANGGSISGSTATGNIICSGATNTPQRIGGFIGTTEGALATSITTSSASGTVTVPRKAIYVGGFTGYEQYGSISNSNSSGEVKVGVIGDVGLSAGSEAGGFAGYLNTGKTITRCNSTGNVTVYGSYSDVGGFIGGSNGTIIESTSTGSVSASNWSDRVGGFIGVSAGTIQKSSSIGDVISYSGAGGFAGTISGGLVENSYCRGNVSNTIDYTDDEIGGFVARFTSGTVRYSFSTGTAVPAMSSIYRGGFAGRGLASTANYWDTDTSSLLTSDSASGLTTSQLKDSTNLIGWDFYRVWRIDPAYNNGYPSFLFLNPLPPTAPVVSTTSPASDITDTTATAAGNVIFDGNDTVTQRGIVYSSVNNNPTTSDSKTLGTGETGEFSVALTGLSPSTLYYFRAYATNSHGTTYGDVVTFTTLSAPTVPSVQTISPAIFITITKATVSGYVTDDGRDTLTERGIVYSSVNSVPDNFDTVVTNVGTTGAYSVDLSGLSPSTLYYFRAYATNSHGTTYGNVVTFTTQTSGPPNDNFTDSIVIPSSSTTSTNGYNEGATIEPSEPITIDGSDGFESVWYSWTAPADETIYVDTCYAKFDTMLGVYTGDNLAGLSLVAQNDEGCGGYANASGSAASFSALAGTTYRFQVSSWDVNNFGALNIRTASVALTPTPIPTSPPTPTNTPTNTPTLTPTPSPTSAPTFTPTPTDIATPTPTSTPTTNHNQSSNNNSSSSDNSPNQNSAKICGDADPASTPNLFQIDTSTTTAKLFFTPISNTNKFVFGYSIKPNAEEHGAEVVLAREGVQNFTISLLKPNTIYYFKVRGQNGCKSGAWSNVVKIKTNSQKYYKSSSLPKIISKVVTKMFSKSTPVIETRPQITVGPTQMDKPIQKTSPSIIPTSTPTKKSCFLWWCF